MTITAIGKRLILYEPTDSVKFCTRKAIAQSKRDTRIEVVRELCHRESPCLKVNQYLGLR